MTGAPGPAPWLHRTLLRRLLWPLLAIVAVTAAVGIYTAGNVTDGVFDRWLLDAAASLARQVVFNEGRAEVELPPAAAAMLAYDAIDKTSFSVVQNSRIVVGQPAIPTTGSREAQYPLGRAYDGTFDGQPVRVASVRVEVAGAEPVTVLVAETRIKRQRATRMVSYMFIPTALLLLATMAAIGIAVRTTIRPLETIAASWTERSHASLEPISAEGVPRELAPFAAALNGLLQRIREMLARERRFVATAAHQLRTPLAGLQLGLDRARHAPNLQATRQVIDELSVSTQRTARVLQQLLTLGRLDPESMRDVQLQTVDLVELTREVGTTLTDIALTKAVNLELHSPRERVTVLGHPESIAEAIANVLDNALRYTPAGGRVVIEFESEPPTLHVCDSGPGIPVDERRAVFDRFVRGREAVGDGSGLGLAIVHDIAVLHRASVTVSDAPLGGARVSLVFPPSR